MNNFVEIYFKQIFIIHVFTVTFDQFNASLLNKSINLHPRKKKNLTDPKLLNRSTSS